MFKYNHLILGGTFDHFHLGHKKLINLAFKLARNVSLGITTNSLIQKKFLFNSIESYQRREKSVVEYLKTKGLLSRVKIIPIADIYGTAKTKTDIEALICSKATYKNALKVNKLRKKIGFAPLEIIVAPFIRGDDGKIITSERIRYGEIDRAGHSYFKIISGKRKLILPENLREELRKPFGKTILGFEKKIEEPARKIKQVINRFKPTLIISVGDIISLALNKVKINPEIIIIDFRSRRKKIDYSLNLLESRIGRLKAVNNPGSISGAAARAINKALRGFFTKQQKQLITVNGEEDLLVLPAVLLAPLGSIVLYGQMDIGAILVEVTEEKKKQAEKLLKKFI